MPSAGKGYVDIEPDLKNFGRELNSKLVRESKTAGDQFNKGFSSKVSAGLDKVGMSGGKLSKVLSGAGPAAVAGAAVAAGAALTSMVQDGIHGLMEAERVGAQVTATIESTGGAANVTAAHVRELGDQFQQLVGVESETLQTGADVLLTFANIRNEQGKGNDIFDQTVDILGDLIVRGGDAKASAIQLGKALNDPIKGMTALSKAGVSFDEQQRKTIRSLVETGDMMGAQKVILAELTKEFGNSTEAYAKTSAAAAARVKAEWGEFKEGFASGVLPVIENATAAIDKLGGHGESAGQRFGKVWIGQIKAVLTGGGSLIAPLIDKITGRHREAAAATDKHGAAAGRTAAALQGEADAAGDDADAVRDLAKAHEESLRAQLARLDSTLSAREAELSFRDAVDTATAALKDGSNTAREDEQSLLAAQNAALRVAAAEVKLAEDTANAAGVQLDAQTKTDLTKEALLRLAGTLAPGSPLRVHLEGLIGQLERLPEQQVIDIVFRQTGFIPSEINGRSRTKIDADPSEPGSARATGGPVFAGREYLVGERGPEKFVPAEDGMIVPNHELMGDRGRIVVPVYLNGREIARAQEDRRRARA